jgi:hypothetical protein
MKTEYRTGAMEHPKRKTQAVRWPALRRFPGRLFSVGCAMSSAVLLAQVPDAPLGPPTPPSTTPQAPATVPKTGTAPGGPAGSFLGKDVPKFDPKTEVFTWDGKSWNVNNNRLFQARFEKYLSAPEEAKLEDRQYQGLISEILTRTAQASATKENIDYAFRLLIQAAQFDVDARLSDSLADAVYNVWMAKREQVRLESANRAMQYEVMQLEAQTRLNAAATQHANEARQKMAGGRRNQRGQQQQDPPPEQPMTTQAQVNDAQSAALDISNWKTRRLAELVLRQQANIAKRELSEIQAKVEYQALVVQFFFQRRFQHVLMGTRFYRAIFSDGDAKLNLSNETKELFTKNIGFSPTISTLDSLANEALRDVREGVKAFEYLLQQNELESATKRLAEAFAVGEFVPEIRTLAREKKRKALEFSQKSNQLLSTMEAKDFGSADKLLTELAGIAKDFDGSQARALIETARRGAQIHLAAARNAALKSDDKTFKEEIAAAAELWPLNPALAEVSQKIFDQGDVQQKALVDFDQLLSQKNHRQIFDNKERYLAATAFSPERQAALKSVLQDMQTIEAAILRAQEMKRQSNFPGAWESVEKIAGSFPDDSKLNQVRADLTTQAAEFVRTVRNALDLEKKEQVGSSLAWFLKAQKMYPASEVARDGIDRLKKKILPAE